MNFLSAKVKPIPLNPKKLFYNQIKSLKKPNQSKFLLVLIELTKERSSKRLHCEKSPCNGQHLSGRVPPIATRRPYTVSFSLGHFSFFLFTFHPSAQGVSASPASHRGVKCTGSLRRDSQANPTKVARFPLGCLSRSRIRIKNEKRKQQGIRDGSRERNGFAQFMCNLLSPRRGHCSFRLDIFLARFPEWHLSFSRSSRRAISIYLFIT